MYQFPVKLIGFILPAGEELFLATAEYPVINQAAQLSLSHQG
jgi:hypothetical protein